MFVCVGVLCACMCVHVFVYRYVCGFVCVGMNIHVSIAGVENIKGVKKSAFGTGRIGLFVGCLLNVPETCECMSGTDLLRQFYMLPHRDRSCGPNFLSHPVTVY